MIYKTRNHFAGTLATNPNLLFLLAAIVFAINSTINYFFHFPGFVAFRIVMLLILIPVLFFTGGIPRYYLLYGLVFISCSLVHLALSGLHQKNISDLTSLLFFPVAYLYYDRFREKIKRRNIIFFSVLLGLMFSFTLLGIDSGGGE